MERYGSGTTVVNFHTRVLLTRVTLFKYEYCTCIYGFVKTVSHLCFTILPFVFFNSVLVDTHSIQKRIPKEGISDVTGPSEASSSGVNKRL